MLSLKEIHYAAIYGDVARIEQELSAGVSIDERTPKTLLTALHCAVGSDQLDAAQYLVSLGAKFLPDAEGRMPTVVAADCEVSDEMCDFIAEAEEAYEARLQQAEPQSRFDAPGLT